MGLFHRGLMSRKRSVGVMKLKTKSSVLLAKVSFAVVLGTVYIASLVSSMEANKGLEWVLAPVIIIALVVGLVQTSKHF